MKNKPINRTHSKGLGMTEVLISMLILSVGMLGMAGLQIRGLQASHDSYYRTQAVTLVQDMADRMRTNLGNIGSYVMDSTTTDYDRPACLDDNDNPCAADDMDEVDAYFWLNLAEPSSVPSLLLLGQGNVTDNGDNTFTITVMWDDDRQGTDTDCGAAADALTCYSMTFTP